MRQRTELVNALRSVLYEFGHPIPPGIGQLKRIEATVEAENSDLPELVRDECRDILLQIAEKTQRIEVKAKQIGAPARMTETARRLQTMPGVARYSCYARFLLLTVTSAKVRHSRDLTRKAEQGRFSILPMLKALRP